MSTQFSNGWAQVELGELIDKSTDKADPTEIDPVPYVGLEHIEQGTGKLSGHGQSSEVKSTKAKFSEGDLLYGKLRPYLNKVWIASFDGVCSTDILVFPPAEKVSQKYLYYRLLSSDFVQYANAKSSGVNHPRVSYKKVSQFEVGLPSLSEQRRIVAKIEELFSELEAGVADLKRAKKQLQRYRKSVLQAAVEGRLTADWRRTHDPEPADRLLERILEERREQWEERYRWERYESKGKEPPSGWKDRYSEPEEPELNDELPELPETWEWVSLDQVLLEDLRNGKSVRSREGGFPVLRLNAIENGEIDTSVHKEGDWTEEEASKFIIERNDFFVARGNGSIDLVGRGGLVVEDDPLDVAFPDTMVRVRVHARRFDPHFLRIAWDSRLVREHLESAARTSAGIHKVNQDDLRSTLLPLPPSAEQKQIVNEVERLLSVADDAAVTVEREIKRAERLRQSILKRAFSGQLVEKEKRSGKVGEMLPLFDEEGTQQVQNKEANNALKNLRGQWPGEESIDELLDALD